MCLPLLYLSTHTYIHTYIQAHFETGRRNSPNVSYRRGRAEFRAYAHVNGTNRFGEQRLAVLLADCSENTRPNRHMRQSKTFCSLPRPYINQ